MVKTEGFRKNFMEWSVQIRRRSETTGFIAKALRVLHETVGMLSDLEFGASMRTVGAVTRRVASWRTRETSSR